MFMFSCFIFYSKSSEKEVIVKTLQGCQKNLKTWNLTIKAKKIDKTWNFTNKKKQPGF